MMMKSRIDGSEETIEVDTTPPGVDPEEPASFSGEDEDEPENLWAQSFTDEPWDDYDPESDDPESAADVIDFAAVELENTSSYEHWVQSALKALVDPMLQVDGILGRRSRNAIKRFQARAHVLRGRGPKLSVDGIVGEATLAALEALTQSCAPTGEEASPTHEPVLREFDGPVSPGEQSVQEPRETPVEESVQGSRETPVEAAESDQLVITETERDGVTVYVIRSGDDSVSFSYWTENYRKYNPFNVSRFRGGKKNLLDDATIIAAGYSISELRILKANALKESGGTYGAINTWDNQIVSWGMAQFAGHAGTLASLLSFIRELPDASASYKKWFADNGLDVEYGEYPWKDKTKKGWHVVVKDGDKLLRGDDGWRFVRTQPRLLGAFMLAGNDPAMALGQVLYWRRSFLNRALRKIIGRKKGVRSGARVMDFLTAERSLALMVRLFNWMPAYVRRWGDRFLDELAELEGEAKVYSPSAWDQKLETWWAERMMKERREVKEGSYDDYALDLSRDRGTFVVGEEPD